MESGDELVGQRKPRSRRVGAGWGTRAWSQGVELRLQSRVGQKTLGWTTVRRGRMHEPMWQRDDCCKKTCGLGPKSLVEEGHAYAAFGSM